MAGLGPHAGDRPDLCPYCDEVAGDVECDVGPGVGPLDDGGDPDLEDAAGVPGNGRVQVPVHDQDRPGEAFGGGPSAAEVGQVTGIPQPGDSQPGLRAEQRVVAGPEQEATGQRRDSGQLRGPAGLAAVFAVQADAGQCDVLAKSLRPARQHRAPGCGSGRRVDRAGRQGGIVVTGNDPRVQPGSSDCVQCGADHLGGAVVGDVSEDQDAVVSGRYDLGEHGVQEICGCRASRGVVPDAVGCARRGQMDVGEHREPERFL